MHFFILKRKTLAIFFIIFCSLFLTTIWLFLDTKRENIPAINPTENTREIHMVTGEFKATTIDGKKIETYRWDPGTIFIKKGEKVVLNVYGVNGREHPFIIEGTNIKGTIKQNEETAIPLQFSEEGIYRMICLTHSDKAHDGPMIAYIVVD